MSQGWLATGLAGLVLTGAVGAQESKQLVRVDVAPPPSERFPAEWYPENSYASMDGPVVGAPFTGTTILKTTTPVGAGRPPIEIVMHDLTMRDTAGRTRSEESVVGIDGPRQIEVNDVVRHCQFRWDEPARDVSQQVAQVTCYRKLSWTDDGMEAKMTRQIPIDVKNQWETDHIEPLGEKKIDGLKVFGVRLTRKAIVSGGSNYSVDSWWSPELRELLLFQPVGVGFNTSIEMTNIRRGEPDSALFYPPAGWRIEHQPEP